MTWNLCDNLPTPGMRFVVLYCDGSGADLFLYADDCRVYDAHGKDVFEEPISANEIADQLFDMGFIFWAAVPEGMTLFFEGAGE